MEEFIKIWCKVAIAITIAVIIIVIYGAMAYYLVDIMAYSKVLGMALTVIVIITTITIIAYLD